MYVSVCRFKNRGILAYMEGQKPIKIELKKDSVFREKREVTETVKETEFSEEQDNEKNYDGEKGNKVFSLMNKESQEVIGSIYYDENDKDSIIKFRTVGLEEKYKGQNLGNLLYEHLIEIARNKNLNGIGSDSSVNGGGIVVWKKLLEKGYNVQVHPAVQKKWNEFLKTYNEGKFFQENLRVNKNESVFKLLI